MHALLKSSLLLTILLLGAGCATLGARDAEEATVVEASPHLRDESRLDVGLLVFDPGLPPSDEEIPERVHAGIRSAEAYYLPCLLRITLQRSKQWGDVFLAPRENGAIELTLRVEIVESDGDQLLLDVEATDATRLVWLDKRYELETREFDYYEGVEEDPYQRMFNTIANDLAEARDDLSPEQLHTIRTVASLRFAEEFAPEAFSGYLEPDEEDLLRPVRLPAHGDPMLDRIMQARASEAMFVDTLNGHYEGLCSGMTESYLNWREHSRNEAIMYRKAQRRKVASIVAIPVLIAAVVGGAMAGADTSGAAEAIVILGGLAVTQLYTKAQEYGAEADLHRATLEELDTSFDAEVAPMVVETEGKTHRITGSVDEQYEEWRRLLRTLYEAETGVLSDLDAHIDRPVEVLDAAPEEIPEQAEPPLESPTADESESEPQEEEAP